MINPMKRKSLAPGWVGMQAGGLRMQAIEISDPC
jgi:hypothetical protein